jgi:hypothetical protein
MASRGYLAGTVRQPGLCVLAAENLVTSASPAGTTSGFASNPMQAKMVMVESFYKFSPFVATIWLVRGFGVRVNLSVIRRKFFLVADFFQENTSIYSGNVAKK